MSFTRFHDDPCRIEKQLQESTRTGKYMLNVPGNGSKPCFMEDPFIRMQKWGANLQTNSINLESDLKGLTRTLNNDCKKNNDYKANAVRSNKINYPSCNPTTEQPRAINPAWTARDLEQVNWYILPLDPQENVCIPFRNNISTRILEKDYFVPKIPCVNNGNEIDLYSDKFSTSAVKSSSLCTATNMCNPY
jgi:hypothetical protein